MANKFAKSLQGMVENTNIENQGVGINNSINLNNSVAETIQQPESSTTIKKVVPDMVKSVDPVEIKAKKNSIVESEGVVALPKTSLNTEAKTKKSARTGAVSFDVGEVVNKLGTKGRKGRNVSLYLNNEVMDRIEAMSMEKNIGVNKIVNAILENVILNQ